MKYSLLHRFAAVAILMISSWSVQAQFMETIQTDRPCQSISALTVGKNVLQFQQGLDYGNARLYFNDNRISEAQSWIFNNVIRLGLTEKFEINAALDYSFIDISTGSDFELAGGTSDLFTAFDLGARYNILEGTNGGPAWCLQARASFTELVQENAGNNVEIGVKIVSSLVQSLNRYQSVTVNLTTNTFDDLGYTLNYALSITPKFGWIIENYGNYIFSGQFEGSEFLTYFDTGFWYLLNNNTLLDVQAGFGNNQVNSINDNSSIILVTNDVKSFFVGAGISWRILNNG